MVSQTSSNFCFSFELPTNFHFSSTNNILRDANVLDAYCHSHHFKSLLNHYSSSRTVRHILKYAKCNVLSISASASFVKVSRDQLQIFSRTCTSGSLSKTVKVSANSFSELLFSPSSTQNLTSFGNRSSPFSLYGHSNHHSKEFTMSKFE